METTMTYSFTYEMLSKLVLADSGFTGTTPPHELFETTKRDLQFGIREKIAHRHLREAGPQRRYQAFPNITTESADKETGRPSRSWASPDIIAESVDNKQI